VTLVDTNVLLDVLLAGARHGDDSERRLAAALRVGPVFVNDVAAAELAPLFAEESELWRVLRSAQIQHAPYPRAAIYVAGQAFLRYRRAGGTRQRIMPDFMIGAHAAVTGASLLTRDRGFYRGRFPGLRLSA
jgi:predicted nucleic acid-binding protein